MGEHNFLDSLYSQNVSFSNYTFKGLEKKTSTTLENQETVRRKVATSPQTKQGFSSKKRKYLNYFILISFK